MESLSGWWARQNQAPPSNSVEAPLLSQSQVSGSSSPSLRASRLLRSRPVLWLSVCLAVYLVILIDRNYVREIKPGSSSTFHLVNAVAARACTTLPPSLGGLRSALCTKFEERITEIEKGIERDELIKELKIKESVNEEIGEIGIEMDRMMGSERCERVFPNLYNELDRVVDVYGKGKNISLSQLDEAIKHGHARVLIYHNRVYIKQFNGGPGKRTEAILNSIQEAVITSPERLPNVEFVIKTTDAPVQDDDRYPLWVLDRTSNQEEVWLMPDFGFYAWPEPKVGSMIEVRDKCAKVERELSWSKKITKAFWRGAILVKLREQMIEIAKHHEWNDIKPLVWQHLDGLLTSLENHCRYKYVIHAEGYAYSGRLKYLQMCRSVVVSHEMKFIQHFHHLLDSDPDSPTQNIALASGPGFEGLPDLMDKLIHDDARAELIANNSVRLFRHYLSPAGISCYWREMFRSWSKVQGFEPIRQHNDTAFESFNLMHTVHWNPH
ncbi:hypothetical protein CROQUDRAFT_657479 [Cronartium quercuum f. sp. fusiforme G11]|uniref:Glycosyl transferase CAP10 domain-containing protein n=1 Tax=Cronartium quercuum f. sp. fusiforme G11 TaxID=708437 RepID=A0A9P6NLF7_9BASI|nr:hypothetical protein CROQUDRAFT_657479 [Cronartium quercuum f. sp. fusiforme G11]